MTGKVKSISHGINNIKYISGKSRHKRYPELIYHAKDNLLPCGLDAQDVWIMTARCIRQRETGSFKDID